MPNVIDDLQAAHLIGIILLLRKDNGSFTFHSPIANASPVPSDATVAALKNLNSIAFGKIQSKLQIAYSNSAAGNPTQQSNIEAMLNALHAALHDTFYVFDLADDSEWNPADCPRNPTINALLGLSNSTT